MGKINFTDILGNNVTISGSDSFIKSYNLDNDKDFDVYYDNRNFYEADEEDKEENVVDCNKSQYDKEFEMLQNALKTFSDAKDIIKDILSYCDNKSNSSIKDNDTHDKTILLEDKEQTIINGEFKEVKDNTNKNENGKSKKQKTDVVTSEVSVSEVNGVKDTYADNSEYYVNVMPILKPLVDIAKENNLKLHFVTTPSEQDKYKFLWNVLVFDSNGKFLRKLNIDKNQLYANGLNILTNTSPKNNFYEEGVTSIGDLWGLRKILTSDLNNKDRKSLFNNMHSDIRKITNVVDLWTLCSMYNNNLFLDRQLWYQFINNIYHILESNNLLSYNGTTGPKFVFTRFNNINDFEISNGQIALSFM